MVIQEIVRSVSNLLTAGVLGLMSRRGQMEF